METTRAVLADRTFRRMVLLLLVTEFLWGLGTYFVLPSTTIPSYLKALHASPVIIGLMATTLIALPLVLQLSGRAAIERFPHRKLGLIFMHLAVIAPYFIIPALDVLLANRPLVIALMILLLAASQITIGLIIPVWLDMVAQVIPLAVRGRYFGVSAGAFALGGVLGGAALMVLQGWLRGIAVFHGAFIGAGVCFLLSMTAFFFTPIPESAFAHPPAPPLWTRVRTALAACRPGSDFGRFVLSYAVQVLATAIVPFLVVYASDARGLALPEGIFSRITLWQALGGSVGALIIGWLVDHHGPRWPWVGVTLVMPLVLLLYPHGAILPILVLCSLFVGLLNTHWSVGGPALLELSPEGDKSGYVAIGNMAGFLPAAVGPILIGQVITSNGYPPAFLAAGITGLVAFTIALTIRGRRCTPTTPVAAGRDA